MASRLVSCGNCKSRFPTSQVVPVFFQYKVPNCHPRVVQSLTDGFASLPMKQMKSCAEIGGPVGRISQILKKGNVPCPKCNKIHWQ